MNGFRSSCMGCAGTGWINAIKRIDHTIYAFRCTRCDAAKNLRLSERIPAWLGEIHKKEFELFSNYYARRGWETTTPSPEVAP